MLAKAEADQEALAAARYLTESEQKNRVDDIATERKAWRMDAVRDAMQAILDDLQTEVTRNFFFVEWQHVHPQSSLLRQQTHNSKP